MEDPSTKIARLKRRITKAAMGIVTFTLLASSCTPKPNLQSKNNDTQKQPTEVLIKNASGTEAASPADSKVFQKAVEDIQQNKTITGSTAKKVAQITEKHGTQGSYEDELLASAKEDLQMGLAHPTRLNDLVAFVKENYNITNETGDDIIYSPESVIQDSKEMFSNSKKCGVLEICGLELHLMKYPDGGAILDVGLADPVAGTYISSLSVVNESEQSLAEMKNQCPDDLDAEKTGSTRSIHMSVDSEGNVSTSGFDAKGLNTWQEESGKIRIINQDNRLTEQQVLDAIQINSVFAANQQFKDLLDIDLLLKSKPHGSLYIDKETQKEMIRLTYPEKNIQLTMDVDTWKNVQENGIKPKDDSKVNDDPATRQREGTINIGDALMHAARSDR